MRVIDASSQAVNSQELAATPLELQATVPDYMVPFAPILEKGQAPFPMFVNLQNKYDWVLPLICYSSIDRPIEVLGDKRGVDRLSALYRCGRLCPRHGLP
jgi:hypothetical protein